MVVKFFPNDRGNPPGKVADAELHFVTGPLSGLKLIGFALWERRSDPKILNVTYSVNGERRSFTLLRVIADAVNQDRLRDLIIAAWDSYKAQQEDV